MLPTLKPNQIVLARRDFLKGRERVHAILHPKKLHGKIAMFYDPEGTGKIIVKRINYVSVGTEGIFFWVLGDNPDESRDSREFGFLPETLIVGEVVTWTQKSK